MHSDCGATGGTRRARALCESSAVSTAAIARGALLPDALQTLFTVAVIATLVELAAEARLCLLATRAAGSVMITSSLSRPALTAG
jgi:hypothetical protein